MSVRVLMTVLIATSVSAIAQTPAPAQAPPPIVSPEVAADRRVTFRLRAPNAKEVVLSREGAEPAPLQKDEQGVWSLTVGPLAPDFYGYTFVVDGLSLIDPSNPAMKPNLLSTTSVVHVRGSFAWDVSGMPRGTLHRHFYRSAIIGDDRDFYVYTPPEYDAGARRPYPVLYLLHGFSDDASGWTSVGQAHVILDNLIAQAKARPMLLVMPLGYGAPAIVSRSSGGLRDPKLRQVNYEKFRDALFAEVIPQIEQAYRVSKDREARAIAGLSMGGAESLFVGLNAVDRFAWIGAFSSGGLSDDFNATFPALDAAQANKQLRLLWIACGTEDRLIGGNRKLRGWLNSKGIKPTEIETPGAHSWMVWRRNLAEFASLLFQRS